LLAYGILLAATACMGAGFHRVFIHYVWRIALN